jgi:hypothetical protein
MLTKDELKQTTAINADFQDKGTWYQWAYERFAGKPETASHDWRTAADVCSLYGHGSHNTKAVGRALALLAKEGHIKMKEGRSRIKLYYVNPSDTWLNL